MYISEHCEICNAFAFCFTVERNGFFMKTIDVCEKCLKELDKHADNVIIEELPENSDSWLYGVKDNIRHF
jgi:hypothetical protein